MCIWKNTVSITRTFAKKLFYSLFGGYASFIGLILSHKNTVLFAQTTHIFFVCDSFLCSFFRSFKFDIFFANLRNVICLNSTPGNKTVPSHEL